MYQFIIVVHVLLGLGVIGLVLMQQGKGADAGAAFGSGSSGSVFGAQGAASFLSRTTAILATLFFSTSLGLAVLVSHQSRAKDLMDTPVEVEKKGADVPAAINTTKAIDPAPVAVDVPVTPTSTGNAPTTEKPTTVDSGNKVDENKAVSDTEKKESADKKSETEAKKVAADSKPNASEKKAKDKSSKKADKED